MVGTVVKRDLRAILAASIYSSVILTDFSPLHCRVYQTSGGIGIEINFVEPSL